MILYNVTVNIDDEVKEEWLAWMREKHIPDVLATGLFVEYKLFRLLTEDEDAVGTTYAIQYFAKSMSQIEEYKQKHAAGLQEEHSSRYKDRYIAFRTLLQQEE
jgi:hypothetical protein